jgi:hypothetical protein
MFWTQELTPLRKRDGNVCCVGLHITSRKNFLCAKADQLPKFVSRSYRPLSQYSRGNSHFDFRMFESVDLQIEMGMESVEGGVEGF